MNQQSPDSSTHSAASESPIILASGSPRRKRLLEMIGITFEIEPSDIEERPQEGESPPHFALRAAREKALDVATRHPDSRVLGADTVVEIDGVILGKPRDAEDACRMLRSLSGRDHLVHTGVALAVAGNARELVDTASVRFSTLDDDIISWYVGSGEPMDKAGAYAIQGIGGLLVAELRGSPHTVVGLPIHRLPELFAAQDLDFWRLLTAKGT
ncbi:MAG: Maf family protein [Acidobacteriota bacterium]|nr:Maf family protein [Acidobacteriota bacterium]